MYVQEFDRGRRPPASLGAGGRTIRGTATPSAVVLQLQRTAGNRAVVALLGVHNRRRLSSVQRDAPPGPAATTERAEDIYDFLETPSSGDVMGTSEPGTSAGGAGSAPAVPAGAPGLLAEKDEAAYRARGEAKLAQLGGPLVGTVTTGHTPAGPIAGFPDWFTNLQNRLIGSTDWRADMEEPGQRLLEEYALKRFAVAYNGDASKIPPSVRAYAHYIGRSTSNQRAAAKAGLPHTGEIGGDEGAKLWCATAGTSSLEMALASVGLKFQGGKSWPKNPPVPMVGFPKAAVEAPIAPGDQVSYIGGGAPVTGGHTTTVVSPSQGEGSVFIHVSGNAGGGVSGSVRMTSSKPRAVPPKGITQGDLMTKVPASIGASPDHVWVYAIVKYSQMWTDLGSVDATAPDAWTTGPGAAFVKKYRLEVLPLST